MLPTFTGIFAGGKRRKCQEQIAEIKRNISVAEKAISDSEKEIDKQNRLISSAEERLQNLLEQQ